MRKKKSCSHDKGFKLPVKQQSRTRKQHLKLKTAGGLQSKHNKGWGLITIGNIL